MEVTASDIARVPVTNLRVPRAEFGVLWATAERLCDEQGERGITDWYGAGVVVTCRWLAGAATRTATGRAQPAYSPVTGRLARAYEELIDAELMAAEEFLVRVPAPAVRQNRPGWIEAITATLHWAWRHAGPPPLDLELRELG